ncbi:MAG: hypothetical protein M1440_03355 [Gammaproteobacteria bacterium]|nr:hypothetical protein [Gammaproteobacteria bacterium]
MFFLLLVLVLLFLAVGLIYYFLSKRVKSMYPQLHKDVFGSGFSSDFKGVKTFYRFLFVTKAEGWGLDEKTERMLRFFRVLVVVYLVYFIVLFVAIFSMSLSEITAKS